MWFVYTQSNNWLSLTNDLLLRPLACILTILPAVVYNWLASYIEHLYPSQIVFRKFHLDTDNLLWRIKFKSNFVKLVFNNVTYVEWTLRSIREDKLDAMQIFLPIRVEFFYQIDFW